MAMLICPSCGLQVSDKAKKCVHCPACKSHMILAKNARGTAYLKCSNKACKETKYLTVDLMNWYINSHNIKCPKKNGGELKGGLGKYGPYVRCNCGHFLKPDEI